MRDASFSIGDCSPDSVDMRVDLAIECRWAVTGAAQARRSTAEPSRVPGIAQEPRRFELAASSDAYVTSVRLGYGGNALVELDIAMQTESRAGAATSVQRTMIWAVEILGRRMPNVQGSLEPGTFFGE